MKGIRSIINAVLVAVLVKPLLRRSIARWRRRAREAVEAVEVTIAVPAQELMETVLAARLAPEAPSHDPVTEETGGREGWAPLRIVLISIVVAGLATAVAVAIAAVRRRRRSTVSVEPAATKELVAIPIDVPAEVSQAIDTPTVTASASE